MELGEVHGCWCGGKTKPHDTKCTLSQKAYIDAVASHFHLKEHQAHTHPWKMGIELLQVARAEGNERPFPYREMIGALMYAAMATRPDITFAMSTLDSTCRIPPGSTGRQLRGGPN